MQTVKVEIREYNHVTGKCDIRVMVDALPLTEGSTAGLLCACNRVLLQNEGHDRTVGDTIHGFDDCGPVVSCDNVGCTRTPEAGFNTCDDCLGDRAERELDA